MTHLCGNSNVALAGQTNKEDTLLNAAQVMTQQQLHALVEPGALMPIVLLPKSKVHYIVKLTAKVTHMPQNLCNVIEAILH